MRVSARVQGDGSFRETRLRLLRGNRRVRAHRWQSGVDAAAGATIPSGRSDPNERRWLLCAVRGNPSSGQIERSSPPVDASGLRNGYQT